MLALRSDAYHALKKEKGAAFKELVQKHRELNPDSSSRSKVRVDFIQFRETRFRESMDYTEEQSRRMTQKQWLSFACSLEGGEKPPSVALKDWDSFVDDAQRERDFEGRGPSGCSERDGV